MTLLASITTLYFTWDTDNLISLMNENQGTFQNLALYYFAWFVLNIIMQIFVMWFKNNNKNLIPTVSSYHYLVHINNTLFRFHDAAIAILLCVGDIQRKKLGKMTNIYCYVFQLVLKLILSTLQWRKDYVTHISNNNYITIYRNGKRMLLLRRQTIAGDIIMIQKTDVVPVQKAIVTDVSILASIGIHVITNKMGVNNLSQTGEDVSKQRDMNSYVYGGQIQVSDETCYITVVETYNSLAETKLLPTIFQSLTRKATWVGVITITLITYVITYLQNGCMTDFIGNSIGTFIANNFLIPSFKLNLGLEFWDLCYHMYCSYHGFSVNNHGTLETLGVSRTNHYNTLSPDEIVLCTDKTGTLVQSAFDLMLDACQFFTTTGIENSIIVGHIGAMYRNDTMTHLADCVENGAIVDGMRKKFGIMVGTEFLFKDLKYNISYQCNGEKLFLTRHLAIDYEDKNHGSFSILEINGIFYVAFEMGIGPANIYLGYKRKGTSMKRGMVIGMIQTTANNFDEAVTIFYDILPSFQKKSHRKLPFKYTVCAEFYFNHYFCQNGSQSTDKGLVKLNKSGCPILVISGDKPETLEAIGSDAGLTNGVLVNMNNFVDYDNNRQLEIIRNAISCGVGYFGNASPEGKAIIVSWCQYLGKSVVMAGDQKNDTKAIMKADFGVLNSDGDKSMYPFVNILTKVPMEAIYIYLTKMRLLGTMGKFWFFMSYNMYSYITAIIGFIGIYMLRFEKVSILFMDPWDANLSTVTSSLMLFSCIAVSFIRSHKQLSMNQIVYLAPLKGIITALVVGYVLTLLPIDYSIVSLPAIFLVSMGLFII